MDTLHFKDIWNQMGGVPRRAWLLAACLPSGPVSVVMAHAIDVQLKELLENAIVTRDGDAKWVLADAARRVALTETPNDDISAARTHLLYGCCAYLGTTREEARRALERDRVQLEAIIQWEVRKAEYKGWELLLDRVATAQQATGEPGAATATFRRALALAMKGDDADETNIAIAQSNLSGALHDAGELGEARALLERALKILRAKLGDRHEYVAITEENLGLVLRDLRKPNEARQHLERAIEARGSRRGDLYVANTRLILATILRSTGHFVAAAVAAEAALDARVASLGREAADVVKARVELAAALHELGAQTEATKHAQEARRVAKLVASDKTEASMLCEALEEFGS